MNLPNAITFTRLSVAIIGFAAMLSDRWVPATVLIIIAVLMDFVDGTLARKLKQVTNAGIFWDVMADKIVIVGTFLIIGLKLHTAFFYLGMLMLIRENMMDTIRSIAASRRVVISADKFSKIKGDLFMFSMIGMLINFAFNYNSEIVERALIVIASGAMVLAYASLLRTALKYRSVLTR